MDYLKNAKRIIADGRELFVIRCDASGRELENAELEEHSLNNPTIERLVSRASGKIVGEGIGGIYSQGIVSD